jgi:hypothetical protein
LVTRLTKDREPTKLNWANQGRPFEAHITLEQWEAYLEAQDRLVAENAKMTALRRVQADLLKEVLQASLPGQEQIVLTVPRIVEGMRLLSAECNGTSVLCDNCGGEVAVGVEERPLEAPSR